MNMTMIRTMNTRIMLIAGAMMIAGFNLAETDSGQSVAANHQIVASFDRDMHRPATPRGPVQRDAIATDPLYNRINQALWNEQPAVDPILASFERDLNREAPVRVEIPRESVLEPMYVLVNQPLYKEQAMPELLLAEVNQKAGSDNEL